MIALLVTLRQRVWLGATVRGSGRDLTDIPETSLAALILRDGGLEIACGKFWPHARREHELSIRALPQEEVAEPLLATGSNEEVDVRQPIRCVRRSRHCLRESFPRKRATVHACRGIDDEIARRVVDGDAQLHVATMRGCLLRRLDRATQRGTESIASAQV